MRDYKVYVCPDESLNASIRFGGIICVNKCTLELLDDQKLAAVLAHEITHGEEKHNLKDTKKHGPQHGNEYIPLRCQLWAVDFKKSYYQ